MKASHKPIANPDVVLREEFDDWGVLFHSLTGESLASGPVGVAIWKMLDGQRTLAEVAAAIRDQFEDVPDTVLDDTIAFTDSLHRRRFVTVEDGE